MSKPQALFWFRHDLYDHFFDDVLRNRLESTVELIEPDSLDEAQFPQLLKQVDCVFSTWGIPKLQDQWIDDAPDLKAIFYAAGTVKPWVSQRCYDRNIRITSTAGPNGVPVAQYSVSLITLCLKNILRHFMNTKSGPQAWSKDAFVSFGVGNHATVGIIGASKIGRLVIPELKRLELNVLVYDPFLSAEEAVQLGVEKTELEDLMRRSDVVSLHAPNIPETQQMINRENLSLMKEGATFINTARGALVNEDDLISILQQDKISAVLDVTYPEPPAAGSLLYSLPNCFMSPHMAGTHRQECRSMCRQAIEEVERFFAGEPPVEAVTREMLARMA